MPRVEKPRVDSSQAESDISRAGTRGPSRAGISITRLGKYELIARIGKGGMAQVYLARQRGPANFEKMVVVKTIHPHLAAQKSFIEMLLDEARIAALLKHPSVVDIYDLGIDDETYFIAMEYLNGESMLSVLRAGRTNKQPLDVRATARIISDVADGLHAAHELRDNAGNHLDLVHRDVTPGNIIVLYNGQVKIVDFGIAKARGRLVDETDSRKLKGKLGYVAPEQVRGLAADRRADVFALGVVMWESLTYRRLFRGSKPGTVLGAIARAKIAPPSSVRAEVPPELDQICLKALARDPDQRYLTAQAMYADLEAFLAGTGASLQRRDIAGYMQGLFAEPIAERERLLREMHDSGEPGLRGPKDAIEAFRSPPDDDDDDDEEALPIDRDSAGAGLAEVGVAGAMPAPPAPVSGIGGQAPNHPAAVAAAPTAPWGPGDSASNWQRGGTDATALVTDGTPPVSGETPGSGGIRRDTMTESEGARLRRRWGLALSTGAGFLVFLVAVALWGGDRTSASESAGPEQAAQPAGADPGLAPGSEPDPALKPEGSAAGRDQGAQSGDDIGDIGDAELVIHDDTELAKDGSEATAGAAQPSDRNANANRSPRTNARTRRVTPRRTRPGKRAAANATPSTDDDAPRPDREQAKALYKEGLNLYIKGSLQAAEDRLRRALELAPGYPEPHRALGLLYTKQGNHGRAVRSFRTYLRLAPKAGDRAAIEERITKLGGS